MPNFNFTEGGYSPPAELDFNFGEAVIVTYTILAGAKNSFIAIWADENASLNNGRFYASSTGTGAALSEVELSDNSLRNFYTLTQEGEGDESLQREDIVDINISTAP